MLSVIYLETVLSINIFCSYFNWVSSFPLKDVIILAGLCLIPVWILGMAMFFLIMPLICHFYIVPDIERKTGKKLRYSPFFRITPGGKFFGRALEISRYILYIYRAKKRYGALGLPDGHDRYLLKQVGYTVSMVSRRELIFSYAYQINYKVTWIAFLIAATAGFLARHYP